MARRKAVQAIHPMDQYPNMSSSKRSVKEKLHLLNFDHQEPQVSLRPKGKNQETYANYLLNENKHIVFATGPAGTGKTMLGVMAGIKMLKEGKVKKLIITRPTVGVDGESLGYLPGDLNEKMMPWLQPILAVCKEHWSPKEVAHMIAEEIIYILPIAYCRGQTFKNCLFILDEAQNCSVEQMKAILTRFGEGCKMVITGDLDQTDRKFIKDNGLRDFVERIKHYEVPSFGLVEFDKSDILRHDMVKAVLYLYGEE